MSGSRRAHSAMQAGRRLADSVGLLATRTLPRRAPAMPCDFGQRLVEVVEHPVEPHRERLARVGEHHLARRAVQQFQAQLRFEFDDGPADSRLGEADLVARAAEIAGFGDGLENAKLAQGDIHAPES